jgi:hypothetical protein
MISCSETDTISIQEELNPSLLELNINRIEIDPANLDNPALTLSWSESTYSIQTAVRYRVELSADQSFSDILVAGVVSANSITWSMAQLNTSARDTGLKPFEWATLNARVISFIGTQSGLETISNTVAFEIYPIYSYPFTDLFFVGPACASDWNNDNNNPVLFRSASNSDLFSYTGRFNSGQIKMLEKRGAWAPQYGEENSALKYRPTEDLDDIPAINDFESLSGGYYTFTANIKTLTFSVQPYDASSASVLSSVGISGSATPGGSTATNLAQFGTGTTVFDPHIWYIRNVRLVIGEFQIMVNGSNAWGNTSDFSGKATLNGGSIPVTVEDDYEVWFNDLTGEYHLIPINLSQS